MKMTTLPTYVCLKTNGDVIVTYYNGKKEPLTLNFSESQVYRERIFCGIICGFISRHFLNPNSSTNDLMMKRYKEIIVDLVKKKIDSIVTFKDLIWTMKDILENHIGIHRELPNIAPYMAHFDFECDFLNQRTHLRKINMINPEGILGSSITYVSDQKQLVELLTVIIDEGVKTQNEFHQATREALHTLQSLS